MISVAVCPICDIAGCSHIREASAASARAAMRLSEVRALVIAANQVIFAQDEMNPFRTADFHDTSCDCLRCDYDRLRAALFPFVEGQQ